MTATMYPKDAVLSKHPDAKTKKASSMVRWAVFIGDKRIGSWKVSGAAAWSDAWRRICNEAV
jgi:hypothetical protein